MRRSTTQNTSTYWSRVGLASFLGTLTLSSRRSATKMSCGNSTRRTRHARSAPALRYQTSCRNFARRTRHIARSARHARRATALRYQMSCGNFASSYSACFTPNSKKKKKKKRVHLNQVPHCTQIHYKVYRIHYVLSSRGAAALKASVVVRECAILIRGAIDPFPHRRYRMRRDGFRAPPWIRSRRVVLTLSKMKWPRQRQLRHRGRRRGRCCCCCCCHLPAVSSSPNFSRTRTRTRR